VTFPGINIFIGEPSTAQIDALDRETREWEMRAARGECSWVCADCCCSFSQGMPDACVHGHQGCTDIILRDKREALAKARPTPGEGA
jgi:hypothetical protein